MEPTFNPLGQLFGFTMHLETEEYENIVSMNAVCQYKFRAVPYKPPNEHCSRSLYHYEWVDFLNNRTHQEDYMRIKRADRTGFFLNIIDLFVKIGVAMASDSITQELLHMIERGFWVYDKVGPLMQRTDIDPSVISRGN
jgi:hypothetical protein